MILNTKDFDSARRLAFKIGKRGANRNKLANIGLLSEYGYLKSCLNKGTIKPEIILA
jgi:hypothetical protein